ncbi:MAG: ABC transporter ATP-binding protein [Nitrospirota bacterium]
MTEARFPYGARHHVDNVPDTPALIADSVSVSYPGDANPAISRISLSVPTGTRLALVGPNGSGKSTFLKACAGLLPLREGTIRVYGNRVGLCHHRVAYVDQRNEIEWRFPIRVRELVMGGRYVHLGWFGRPGQNDQTIVDKALEILEIRNLENRQIGELSGGQRQKTLLARAFVQEADLLLLDEPLNALDKESRDVFSKFMAQLKPLGKTAIVATHYYEEGTDEFDDVFYLNADACSTHHHKHKS